MQKKIDESMINVYKEEGVSPKQGFFVFNVGFTVVSYINIIFLCAKDSLWKY